MFPSKVKNINLFNEGNSYLGSIGEYTPIKLTMLTQDWRGGGMIGSVKIDQGIELPEFEWTLGGWSRQVIGQFGVTTLDGVLLRAMGALQDDTSGTVKAVEAVVMGRHTEIDFGNWKPGEDTEKKIKTAPSYYKLIEDGAELVEIDLVGGIYRINGIDRYAEIRAAIGG
jgi:P2 family phage contractile tail tube protein